MDDLDVRRASGSPKPTGCDYSSSESDNQAAHCGEVCVGGQCVAEVDQALQSVDAGSRSALAADWVRAIQPKVRDLAGAHGRGGADAEDGEDAHMAMLGRRRPG